MGFEKIKKMRELYTHMWQTVQRIDGHLAAIARAAQDLRVQQEEYEAQRKYADEMKETALRELKRFDASAVPEFEAFRLQLIKAVETPGAALPGQKDLDEVVGRYGLRVRALPLPSKEGQSEVEKVAGQLKYRLTQLTSAASGIRSKEWDVDARRQELAKVRAQVLADLEKGTNLAGLPDAISQKYLTYKTSMAIALQSPGPRFLPLPDIHYLKQTLHDIDVEIQKLQAEWVEKKVASWPKEIKADMVFMKRETKKLYAVAKLPDPKPPGPATHVHERMYVLKGEDGKEMKLLEQYFNPQGGWKYVKPD